VALTKKDTRQSLGLEVDECCALQKSEIRYLIDQESSTFFNISRHRLICPLNFVSPYAESRWVPVVQAP
jgi:hypothetical protein